MVLLPTPFAPTSAACSPGATPKLTSKKSESAPGGAYSSSETTMLLTGVHPAGSRCGSHWHVASMLIACHTVGMSNVQVKNIPDDVHEQLRVRAAQHGTTISDYVLELIRRDLAVRADEWIETVLSSQKLNVGRDEILRSIDEGRRDEERLPNEGHRCVEHDRVPHRVASSTALPIISMMTVTPICSSRKSTTTSDGSNVPTSRRSNSSIAGRRLHAAPVEYLGTWPYAQAWEWRHNISAYDAMYVAMAADLRSRCSPRPTTRNRRGQPRADHRRVMRHAEPWIRGWRRRPRPPRCGDADADDGQRAAPHAAAVGLQTRISLVRPRANRRPA